MPVVETPSVASYGTKALSVPQHGGFSASHASKLFIGDTFTIEGFFRVTSNTSGKLLQVGHQIIAGYDGEGYEIPGGMIKEFSYNHTTGKFTYTEIGLSTKQIVGLAGKTINTNYYLAVTSDGTTLRLYVDGVLQGSIAREASPALYSTGGDSTGVSIGDAAGSQTFTSLRVKDLRITKNVVRSATAPTAFHPTS
jgi:hypothetical protein